MVTNRKPGHVVVSRNLDGREISRDNKLMIIKSTPFFSLSLLLFNTPPLRKVY